MLLAQKHEQESRVECVYKICEDRDIARSRNRQGAAGQVKGATGQVKGRGRCGEVPVTSVPHTVAQSS